MIRITSDEIHQINSRINKWYPTIKKPYNQDPTLISSIKEIADKFELILLDAYGVLIDGYQAIASSITVVDYLQDQNQNFCVVSNDSNKNNFTFAKVYKELGFKIAENQVVTSLDTTINFIKKIENKSSYAVAIHPSHQLASELDDMLFLYNKPEKILDNNIKNLMFVSGINWSESNQQKFIEYSQNKQFDNIVLANPDIGAPYKNQIIATPGYFLAQMYEKNSQQLDNPILLGKPGNEIFKQALLKYPQIKDYSKVLMVGDGIYTDILGGNAMGFTTLLINSGLHNQDDISNILHNTKISPDYIAASL